jgi:drug/metabolite transporter (DMT)-like permease
MKPIIALVVAMVVADCANMFFKLALNQTQAAQQSDSLLHTALALARNPYFLAGLATYALGFSAWLVVLARARYSSANLYFSLHYVLMLGIAVVVFKEQLTLTRCAGAALIVAGVALVARG